MQQVAAGTGVSLSSVARICRGAGLNRLKNLEPPGPTIRYERDEPGDLLHIDTKRLGRFERIGQRMTETIVRVEEAGLRIRVRRHRRRIAAIVHGGACGRA